MGTETAALVLTMVLFFIQIAAGVAPVRYPKQAWVADIIWWISMVGALACFAWWLYLNSLVPNRIANQTDLLVDRSHLEHGCCSVCDMAHRRARLWQETW